MSRRPWFLSAFLFSGCLVITPSPPDVSDPPALVVPPVAPVIAALQQAILTEVNATRSARRLGPLADMPELDAAALAFAAELARRGTLSHESDVPGMTTLAERLSAAGVSSFRQAGENLARVGGEAYEVAPAVVRLWLESAPHSANLLEPRFNRSGVGIVRAGNSWYVTQVYAQTRGRQPDEVDAR
jgi:uncharacterized protein YkwD